MTGAWRGLREKMRGARYLEWLLLLVALSVAALMLTQNPGSETEQAQPTELEARLERVLSAVEGAGRVRAMVTEREGEIVGVAIVSEGAGRVRVRLALMQAARTLLGVEMDKVEVIEMRREEYAQGMGDGSLLSGRVGGGRGGGVAGVV